MLSVCLSTALVLATQAAGAAPSQAALARAADVRARHAERASDPDRALIARLEALAGEDTPARRAAAAHLVEPYERLLATMRTLAKGESISGFSSDALIEFSPDGRLVAYAQRDVWVFESATGRCVARLSEALARSLADGDEGATPPEYWASAIAFDPSGTRLAACHGDDVTVLELERDRAFRSSVAGEGVDSALAWSRDGRRLAVAAWRWGPAPAGPVEGDPIERDLASADDASDEPGPVPEHFVALLDARTRAWHPDPWVLPFESLQLLSAPRGDVFAALGYRGVHLLMRNPEGAPEQRPLPSLDAARPRSSAPGMTGVFHPTEPLLAVLAGEVRVALWHLDEQRYLGPTCECSRTGREVLRFDATGERLVLGNRRGARAYDARTGAPLAPPSRADGLVDEWREKYADSPLALAPDGSLFAMTGLEDSVRVFDPSTGAPLTPTVRHGAQVRRVALGPGGLLATTSRDGVLRVWQLGDAPPAPPEPKARREVELLVDLRHALVRDIETEVVLLESDGARRSFRTSGVIAWDTLVASGDGRRVAGSFVHGADSTSVQVFDSVSGAAVSEPWPTGWDGVYGERALALDRAGRSAAVSGYLEAFWFDVESGRLLAIRNQDMYSDHLGVERSLAIDTRDRLVQLALTGARRTSASDPGASDDVAFETGDLSSGVTLAQQGDALLLDGEERTWLVTLGELGAGASSTPRRLLHRADAELRVLEFSAEQVVRATKNGEVYATDLAAGLTVRLAGADPEPSCDVLGGGWYAQASGSRVRAFDLANGERRFDVDADGEVHALCVVLGVEPGPTQGSLPGSSALAFAVLRATGTLVDLDAVPRSDELRHVVLARDALRSFPWPVEDDGRWVEPSTVAAALGKELGLRSRATEGWPSALIPIALQPPGRLWLEFDTGLSDPMVFLHLEREWRGRRTPLGSRRLLRSHSDIAVHGAELALDGTLAVSAAVTDGGVDVRIVDFARAGDAHLVGEPGALLTEWRRRLALPTSD